MTEREASRRLTILALSVGHRTAINAEDCEALNMGFEALEKQIPKKPIIKTRDLSYRLEMSYYCPTCNADVEWECDANGNSGIYDYCPNCGQRIDTGDDDDGE